MFFNKNLDYLVRECKNNVPAIAADLNIGYETFRTYLKVSQPKYDVLVSIAKYFHISLDDLLMRDIEIDGHFETPKNEVVNEGAASVYLKSEKATDLNAVVKNLIQEELMPMQLEIYNLKRTVEQLKNQ